RAETASTVGAVRSGPVAALALVAAVLGGGFVLVVAKAAGWLHSGGTTRTVVIRQAAPGAGAAAPVVAARPILGNGFQPAQIYRRRSQGVVTIVSYFSTPDGSAGQGSGFVVSPDGTILTSAHVITSAGQSSTPTVNPSPARRVYVEFGDGDRVS